MILGQLHLLNLKARLIIFSQMIVAAVSTIFLYLPNVITKSPLKNVLLNFTDGSANGKTAYIIVNGKKRLWSVLMDP